MTDSVPDLREALAGRFDIERELGGGGMSQVFVATETALGRSVVIKVVAPGLIEGLSAERFAREVRLAARLQQANIVPLLSAGEANGRPYYTMPYVRGQSLRSRLTSDDALPLPEATGILRDVARALAYAHAEGVVHRDIKPENILLSGGAAMVTDFGIAKALSAARPTGDEQATAAVLTQRGGVIGTPAYMAPEQAVGHAVDPRADLYAWGVTAYELFTGTHPFAHHSGSQRLIAAHIAERPSPIADKRPDLPSALAAIVMRCLEKDPAARPSAATELLSVLENPHRGAALFGGAAAKASRRTRVTALAAAAVVVVVAVLAVSPWRRTPPSETPGPDKSLVVLPFDSVGGDAGNAYFAEGIADELTTAFAQFPGLHLAGRSSAARFKGTGASPQEIGAALDVRAVLGGTVRRAGDRVRVSAELTSTADGRVLWKQSFERELKDVFAVQDDITRAIVSALQVQLAGSAAGMSAAMRPTDAETYDLYLRGLQLYRRRANLDRAEQFLEQAVARDPAFARAHATLAMVLASQPYFLDKRPGDTVPRARAAAERAVALDDGLPEAHQALGHAHQEAFNWVSSERELRRAVLLGPSSSDAAHRLGFMLLTAGRGSEAIAVLERAVALDPYYPVARAYLGLALALAGQTERGLAEVTRSVELDPDADAPNNLLALTYMSVGRAKEVLALARRTIPVSTVRRRALYAAVLGRAGARDEAAAAIHSIESQAKAPGALGGLPMAYLAIGDIEHALTTMEAVAAGDGDMFLAGVPSMPIYDPVRGNPRFAAVLHRFNLDVARLTAPDGGRSR